MTLYYLKRKLTCTLLIFTILMQSCSVYEKESSTFDEAILAKSKVKATSSSGTKYIIKKLKKVDGEYQGEIKSNGVALLKTSLTESDYKTIQLKDKTASTLITVGIIVVPVAIVIILAANSTQNMDLGSNYYYE